MDLVRVLPRTAEVGCVFDESHLFIGGVDTCKIAEEFGTPVMVVDEADLRHRLSAYRDGLASRLQQTRVCFAFKAFTCFETARIAADEGCWLLVASGEELAYALAAGIPASNIVFHGCNKTDAEVSLALSSHIGRIVVDSEQEVEKIDSIAKAHDFQADVLLRVRPGIIADTHEYIQTAAEDSKFGTSIAEGESLSAIKTILASDNLNLKGYQFHIGSQIFNIECFERAFEVMFEFMLDIKQTLGFEAEEVDLGGGLGIAYTIDDRPTSIEDFCGTICDVVLRLCESYDLDEPLIAVEPGRSAVGNSAVTLYTVGTIKEIEGIRTYVALDGGMADNIRPGLYGAVYEAIVANKAANTRDMLATIVGRYCESDVIIESASIQEVQPGDIVAVLATGAYCFSMSMNYNMAMRQPVVFVKDGNCRLSVRRQTLEDLIACELDS